MTTNSAYEKLDALGKKLEALDHAQSMLFVDEAVNMPAGGGEKRAEAMSVLAGMQLWRPEPTVEERDAGQP